MSYLISRLLALPFAMTLLAATPMLTAHAATPDANPLLAPSTLPFQYPPFDKIRDEHFLPAMEQGMRENLAEVEAIANNPKPPTFDNTIVALERSGELLKRRCRAVRYT